METNKYDLLHAEHTIGGPDFRWKLADRYVCAKMRPRDWWDAVTRDALEYMQMAQRGTTGRENAKRKFPSIAAACEMMLDKRSAEIFTLSILGDFPKSEICSRLNVAPQVVDTAEALFFDIRGKREATSWMTCRIFNPTQNDGDIEFAVKMRLAFFGGPAIVRAALDAWEKLPWEDAQRLIDQEVLLHAKLQVAVEYRLTDANWQGFVKMFLDYDLARKKLDFAREQFQHKCELSRRQYETEQASNQRSEDDVQHGTEHVTTGVESPSRDNGDKQKKVA